MKTHRFGYALAIATVVAVLLVPTQCFAGSATFSLRRASLNNVDDAAGRWQLEGGDVLRGATVVAHYAVVRRVVTGGTTPQNTAMVTMTIFFLGSTPPENITLQGAHDFNSGRYIGSVSAASARFNWVRNATFAGSAGATGTLTITWLGSDSLTLP